MSFHRIREVIRTYLAAYLRLVEPDVAGHLDLGSLSFPDLSSRACDELQRSVVAEVLTKREGKATVIVLIEPACSPPAVLARRVRRIFEALEIPLGRPVLFSVLLLRGGRPGAHLETVPVSKLGGLDNLRLYYHAFGLSGATADYYLEDPEPLAWALAAFMRPRHLSRKALKRACHERIVEASLDPESEQLLVELVMRSGVE